ncbi:MAG: MBL fold metallo-hydrolase [Flavobacteriales bacterium]|nr:MBL fold metallo-hydrolase [Flavobacteriales bacterium]
MRKALKWFKRLVLIVFGLLAIVLLIGFVFLKTSPQFGGKVPENQKLEFSKTGHFESGVFVNFEEIQMEMDCHSIKAMIKEFFEPDPNVAPTKDISVKKLDPSSIQDFPNDSLINITWLGHSSFFIQMAELNILLDPVFGQYAAPHPLLGRQRYNREMPITIEELPEIDIVIISHDHYDHLDYESILALKNKTKHFFVPLGIGSHLRSWGISEAKIHEKDWWQRENVGDLELIFAPSRHMSGRRLDDQYATLWGSWVLKSSNSNLYFSGDGGYGSHFRKIGEELGPFDIALMECGQYNELWADVHMMPEETVQASFDIRADMIIPIHWGSFTLATHSWTDPVERVTAEGRKKGLPIVTPEIGQTVVIDKPPFPQKRWWEKYPKLTEG